MNRIKFLDGHRGLAILLVVFYHAYVRWPDKVPYGDVFADFPVFQFGYLGVELFFLISGFVILMTLEKCHGVKEFLYKRWLRLFPAMLVCSLFVILTAVFLSDRPAGQPELKNLLPGLTFIEPYLWEKITGIKFDSVEGAFWSLYVEFKFYIYAGIVFYLTGRRFLVFSLAICFLGYFFLDLVTKVSDVFLIEKAYIVTDRLDFKYFGWFAAGAACYCYHTIRNDRWLLFGILIAVLSSLVAANYVIQDVLAAIVLTMLFFASVKYEKLQTMLSNDVLLFIGAISYPLYLIHENMMISMTIQMGRVLPGVPSVLLPIVAILMVMIVATIVAKKIEKPVKLLLVKLFAKFYRTRVVQKA